MGLDINKLQDSPHLLDILIQMEDVLDSLDVYVFSNWINGVISDGPNIKRYWLDFTLKYPYEKMPDPRAAYRLLKHGIRVDYNKVEEIDHSVDDNQDPLIDKDDEKQYAWLVKISIPRKFYTNISTSQMDFYDEEIDYDDVEDAKDQGIDNESAFTDDSTDDLSGKSNISGGEDDFK